VSVRRAKIVATLGSGPSDAAREQILARGYARKGDRVVVTAGVPFDVPGTTNPMKIEEV